MGTTAKINLDKLRTVITESTNDPFITIDGVMEEIIARCVEPPKETVNHPVHYKGKHECIEVMRAMFGDEAVMNFCKCNSFKYRFRSSAKNGEEDIEKAEWYEDYLINMQNPQKNIIGGI